MAALAVAVAAATAAVAVTTAAVAVAKAPVAKAAENSFPVSAMLEALVATVGGMTCCVDASSSSTIAATALLAGPM